MSNPLSTSIDAGYDFIQSFQGVALGGFTALILGSHNGVYGWHKYEYDGVGVGGYHVQVDGVYDTSGEDEGYWKIENCSVIVFTSFDSRDLNSFDLTLKLFGGTTATSSNILGKLCYFTDGFVISYID